MLRVVNRFWRDERGIALILVSIMLPAIVGFALLAIDMSRANNLHNDLQKAADAFALAAAAELDGQSDAHTRAELALATLVDNTHRFSTTNTQTPLTSDNISWVFLKNIPANDATFLNPTTGVDGNGVNHKSSGPDETRFILVNVNPTDFASIFPASFLTNDVNSNAMEIGATAVAGFGSSVCEYTPMFICNPYNDMDKLAEAMGGDERDMMILKKQNGGNNAQYGPGNYGFLKTPDGSGATPDITEMFASTRPEICYAQNGVETSPGNVPPVNDGINVRFDIYPNGNQYDPAIYPPAPNVIKGMSVKKSGKNCSYETPKGADASKYMAMPRDTCLIGGTCAATGSDRLGDGAWNRSAYWSVNHPSTAWPGELSANASRYQVYQWEVGHPTSHGTEATQPQCNSPTTDVRRRLIYVAVIDCKANPVGGGSTAVPVEAFASFFLTEPAGGPPNADIYGEIVDITTFGNGQTLANFQRDDVQLYR